MLKVSYEKPLNEKSCIKPLEVVHAYDLISAWPLDFYARSDYYMTINIPLW